MSPPSFYRDPPSLPVARTPFQKSASIPKAPIVNPYEKFTQPQFDAWIGDITGALRGALGYRAETPPKPKTRTQWHIPARSSEAPDATSTDVDAEPDGSFAQVKARRDTPGDAKGKGRDPREGPGLGKGDRAAPIEIDLDSDEEEEAEEEEEEEWEEDDEARTSEEEEEEEEYALRNGESSAHAHARYKKYADRRDDDAEEDDEVEGDAQNAIEVISDDEAGDERHANGDALPGGQDSGEEYSDEEDANSTSFLVVPQKKATHEYSDEEEETGSESEAEAAHGSSPPRQTAGQHYLDKPYYANDLGDEDDELDNDVGSSPPRHGGDPEVIDLDSDEDEEGEAFEDEEEALLEDETLGDEEAERHEDHDRPRLSIPRDVQDEQDDDVLPGSSPILSSPIEPEQSFQQGREVFDVDELEDEGDIHVTHTQAKPFAWDHPPAFARGVPASGAGHLATPVEDDIPESDTYPLEEVFGTSDLLPTFRSQVQTESDGRIPQFEVESRNSIEADPFSADHGYFVIEEEDAPVPDNFENVDGYTFSRSISVDPHQFTVEEPFTDYEPDTRGMSIDVVTVDGKLDGLTIPEPFSGSADQELGDVNTITPREDESSITAPQPQLEAEADPALSGEVPEASFAFGEEFEGGPSSLDSQITVEQTGDVGSPLHARIPMPVSADPAVYDAFTQQPPTAPPRPPMVLTLPGSPLLLSPVGTPPGQPTPVSLPVPASLLKAVHIRQESGLFTPTSEIPSAAATPPADPPIQTQAVPASNANQYGVDKTEDNSIYHSQTAPDVSAHLAVLPEEGAEEFSRLVNDEAMVDMLPTEVNDEVEQKDTVSVMHEDERRDTVVDVSAPESPPPTIEELSEETVNERTEEPRDEETSGATETDNSTSSALEQAANPIESPQTNAPDLIVPDFSPETALDSYPSKITLAPSATPVLEVDPYPYSLSTPGEHPDPMEQEEISGVSSPSTGDKDSEKTDDATSVVTSPDNDPVDFDEMELRYLAEPDVKPAADDEAEGMESVGAVDDEESAESVGAVDDELEGTESVGAAADEVEGPESAGVDEVEGTESVGSVDDEVEGAESVGAADDVSEGSETDADGDDDPDYTTSASSVAGNADVEVPSGPEAQESGYMEEEPTEEYTANTEPSRDPDGITNRMVDIAESVDVEAPAEHAEAEDVLGKVNEPLVQEDALVDEISSQLGGIPGVGPSKLPSKPAHEGIEASEIPPTTVEDDDDVDPVLDTGSPPPSLKRKREHATKEAASTGKNLGKIAESRLSRRHTLQRNGKGKAKAEDLEDDASSTSSASSAARMLNPGSRGSSRASSIASARSVNVSLALSDSSPSLLPRVNSIIKAARPPPKHPPASAKPPPPPPAPPPPPPLLHAHSHNRAVPHHRHPPSLSRQPTQQQRLLQRAPSGNGVNEEPPSPSTSSVQMPAPSRRAPPAAGSPVTRSNCRYHRISLPEDDSDQEGPRVRFLVPGCSLGDKDLMDEENIKDEGYATTEDSERMIKDLDALHFDSYLIGTLRQLVGVDLLREQEIYYLPRPDEELRLRHPRRREQSKLRISSGGSFASDGGAMSPGVRSPGSISSRAPNSAAGSSSTTSVQARRRKRSDRGSPTPPAWTQSQGDESTDDESPDAKRIRAAEAEGIAAAASGSPLRTRRSKRRIDKEAAEYKPEKLEAVDESSEEEGDKGRRKKKKANGRGVKRGRQSEATSAQEGGEDRKTKKLKTHESIGGSGV